MILQFLILLPMLLGSGFPSLSLVMESFTAHIKYFIRYPRCFQPFTLSFLMASCLSATLLKRNSNTLQAHEYIQLNHFIPKHFFQMTTKLLFVILLIRSIFKCLRIVLGVPPFKKYIWRCCGHSGGCHSLPTEQLCVYC